MDPKSESYKMFEYRLTDALEMNCSGSENLLKQIKAKLLERPLKDLNLYPLGGFILGRALVVIQNRHSSRVHELYMLNVRKGSFRRVLLRSEGDGNGKISDDSLGPK